MFLFNNLISKSCHHRINILEYGAVTGQGIRVIYSILKLGSGSGSKFEFDKHAKF